MTTTEALIALIKALPEIEFTEVFEEMTGHMHRNKWHHLTNSLFSDRISELEDDIERLEEEVKDAENAMDEAMDNEELCQDKIKELEAEIEQLKTQIQEK